MTHGRGLAMKGLTRTGNPHFENLQTGPHNTINLFYRLHKDHMKQCGESPPMSAVKCSDQNLDSALS